MYEFDKTNFLASCDHYSLAMLYGGTTRDRSEARDKLLAFVRSLAEGYEAAIENLNAIELAKSGGSESKSIENEEDRTVTETISKEDEILEDLFNIIIKNEDLCGGYEDKFHAFDPEEFKCGEC